MNATDSHGVFYRCHGNTISISVVRRIYAQRIKKANATIKLDKCSPFEIRDHRRLALESSRSVRKIELLYSRGCRECETIIFGYTISNNWTRKRKNREEIPNSVGTSGWGLTSYCVHLFSGWRVRELFGNVVIDYRIDVVVAIERAVWKAKILVGLFTERWTAASWLMPIRRQ